MRIYDRDMNRWSRSAILCAGLALMHAAVSADTIQLNTGPAVSATVTKYANNNFEARLADGKTATYSASNVRGIAFDNSNARAQFTTRTNGVQQGTQVAFANGRFSVTTDRGNQQFPLIFVERVAFVPDRGQEIEVIGHGSQVNIFKHLSPGNVTIVDFYADWCGPCRQISPTLEKMAKSDPEIAVRKIDIINWDTPVVKQYNLHAIPQINIYNRAGKLVGTVIGPDVNQVERYVAQAKGKG
jgi:thiol-disulfide isomerase/thioredoxin